MKDMSSKTEAISVEIPIHKGLRIHARYRGDSVFVSVRDDSGEDQITFIERGPNDIVVRAMRDALSHLLGEGSS